MRTVLLIAIAILSQVDLCGQTLAGTFTADNDHFVITKDTIKFEIETISAFRIITRGMGKYEFKDSLTRHFKFISLTIFADQINIFQFVFSILNFRKFLHTSRLKFEHSRIDLKRIRNKFI